MAAWRALLSLGVATAVMVGPMHGGAARADDLLDRFERALAQEDSATQALARWCGAQGMAGEPTIRATRVADTVRTIPDEVRNRLGVSASEPLGYRHVRLMCGNRVLSQARNWYVPARLPPALNQALATGEQPFGAVIAPLGFRRERLDSQRGAGAGCPAATILTNRALIRLPNGEPLALVIECYQPGVLQVPAS